jgi:hypothetical protein
MSNRGFFPHQSHRVFFGSCQWIEAAAGSVGLQSMQWHRGAMLKRQHTRASHRVSYVIVPAANVINRATTATGHFAFKAN